MSWSDVSYVLASKNRKVILFRLDSPKTPTILAKSINLNLANVSRSLTELEDKGLVVCLTPRQRVGKIYSLTNKGREVVSKIKKMSDIK